MSLLLNAYYIAGACSAVVAALSYRNTKVNKKKMQSIKVIKEFQSKIYPRIYDLENNINGARYNANRIAKIRWCERICNKLHWNLNKKEAIFNIINHTKSKVIEDILVRVEDAYTNKYIFKSLEIISTYIDQGLVNKKLVRKEIGIPFEKFMLRHYSKFKEEYRNQISLRACRKVYDKWIIYYKIFLLKDLFMKRGL